MAVLPDVLVAIPTRTSTASVLPIGYQGGDAVEDATQPELDSGVDLASRFREARPLIGIPYRRRDR